MKDNESTSRSYHFFWSGPFSQWKRSTFTLDGNTFNTAEQAMMYGKARLFGDDEIAAQILATSDARRQKALGRKVKGFDEKVWDAHKEEIVARASMEKYRQSKSLRRALFATGDALLVEASPKDLIWGIGLDEKTAAVTPEADWPGQNLLGKILTRTRDALRKEFGEDAPGPAATAPAKPTPKRSPSLIDAASLERRTGSIYPEPFAAMVKGRSSLRLGAAGGLTQFGVNLVTLEPGAMSSLRHWHQNEDEFVMVTDGTCTLIDDHGEHPMQPGDCAAFRAGVANGHHFVNRTDKPASFLVVGTKAATEVAHYSDVDLMIRVEGGKSTFTKADGSPLDD